MTLNEPPEVALRPTTAVEIEAPLALRDAAPAAGLVVVTRRQLIRATNDRQAMLTWVDKYTQSKSSKANARKDGERFLLWCLSKGLTFNTLMAEDLLAYAGFLENPQPASQWIENKRYPRSDPRWKPFMGPLDTASQRQAMVGVLSMLSWLHQAGYTDANPGKLIQIAKPDKGPVERYIRWEALGYMLQAVAAMPTKKPEQRRQQARSRFMVALFSLTAARLSDATGATLASIKPSPRGKWWWHVRGKGRKKAKIPVPDQLVAEFREYKNGMGWHALPSDELEAKPLIPSLRGSKAADESTIYVAIRNIMEAAAALARAEGNELDAGFLDQASPHWLRHTSLTRQADAKMDIRWVQANGRHGDINTTMGYLHSEDDARHEATNKALVLPEVPRQDE